MSLGRDLMRYAQKQNLRMDKVAAAAILETTSAVIRRSPVDTGRLRGNWQPSVNAPAGGTVESTDDNGAATVAKAAPVITQSIGGVFYLVNNLPYARVVEYGLFEGEGPKTEGGYSTQAPAGMVRISAKEFGQALREKLREIK